MARIRLKLPDPRGLTVEDVWDQRRQLVTIVMTVLVAVVVAAVSFQALLWAGLENGARWAAPLLPIAFDGGAVVFMLVIVDSESKGKPWRERVLPWLGLFAVLAVSVAGNVYHGIHLGSGLLPLGLVVAMSATPPILVAILVHLLGTTLRGGLNAHILWEDRKTVRFDLQRVHDYDAQKQNPAQSPAQKPAQPAAQDGAQDTEKAPAQPAQKPAQPAAQGPRAVSDPFKVHARELFDASIRENPLKKPDGAAIHRTIESPADKSTTRRWVQKWWEDYKAEMGWSSDPILEQVQEAAPVGGEVRERLTRDVQRATPPVDGTGGVVMSGEGVVGWRGPWPA